MSLSAGDVLFLVAADGTWLHPTATDVSSTISAVSRASPRLAARGDGGWRRFDSGVGGTVKR
jgi:hypothetical protein